MVRYELNQVHLIYPKIHMKQPQRENEQMVNMKKASALGTNRLNVTEIIIVARREDKKDSVTQLVF